MGIQEEKYIRCFYDRYKGRIAIGVGYAQDMIEIFPFVMEDDKGKALGIIGMAALTSEDVETVHIFHLSAFKTGKGNGSKILRILCMKADRLNVKLSLSPIPAPNGEVKQMDSQHLAGWYRRFGFTGENFLCRRPESRP